MDTITHGMIGALAGRSYKPRRSGGLTPPQRALAGALAATFPDVDYATFWIDPVRFLSTWHRGPTHSLLLVPLWALLLGIAFAWLLGQTDRRRDCVIVAALALLSHIATDVITVYGTAVLFPLSDWRPGLGTTWVIDPWLSGIALLGLLFSWGRPGPGMARTGLVLICMYVAVQAAMQADAERFARLRQEALGTGVERPVRAIAQPLSPFHWKAFVPIPDGYEVSTFRLLEFSTFPEFPARLIGLSEMLRAYPPRDAALWDRHALFGDDTARQALAREVWSNPLMRPFREFAGFPSLYRVDETATETCVWFTDLRFDFPGLAPAFRYGLCKKGDDGPWAAYRLRRMTLNDRVSL